MIFTETFSILIIILIILIYFLILKSHWSQAKLEKQGILYLGNGNLRIALNILKGRGQLEDVASQYSKLKVSGHRIGVSNDFGITTLTIADPGALKSIMVKDFDHFVDRREFFTGNSDYLFKKMLFTILGDNWKGLRSKLSPTFTTGKIKRLFSLFDVSGRKLMKFFEDEMADQVGEGGVDLSEGFSKFTMDIIASAACGIDSQAFDQKESSVFENVGKGFRLDFGGWPMVKILSLALLPKKITDFLKIALFGQDVQDFFFNAIKESIRIRKFTGVKKPDFVELMLEARAGSLKIDSSELEAFEKNAVLKDSIFKKSVVDDTETLDDEGIASNCLLFIIAGYDTTQSLLLFCAYELARNPDIQDKLREEVDEAFKENFGSISYDQLNEMTYLDMVINETLRFYPPAPVIDRCCTMDYKSDKLGFRMKKGDIVTIPIYGLHHDPDHFPEPERFDPERFSAENRHTISPYTFMPFGQGPRNCIGMRFALAEAKVVLSYLVHRFRIEPSSKTPTSIKFATTAALKPDGGIYLNLIKKTAT